MEMTGAPPAAPAWAMGTGNSPPERKCADSPLSEVNVGSASICGICFCSRYFDRRTQVQLRAVEKEVHHIASAATVDGVVPMWPESK